MDSQDHTTTQQHSPGGKSHGAHVCTKCGWNYPNPHPSAKNRRAHKKICGTIKGFEILDSEKAKQNLVLEEEHFLDDEQKTPSPRAVEKADERIGDITEEDVFTDAVCEFSRSDSFKEKEEAETNCAAKSNNNPGETQHLNSSSADCVMKSSEVVQESCEVPSMEVLEKYDVPSLVEAASCIQEGGEHSTEGHSMASRTLVDSSQEAQDIDSGDTDAVSNVGLETECKVNLPEESESKLTSAPASGKRDDTSNPSWNDDVIYSDLEGPHGFAFEATSDYVVSEDVPVNRSTVKANAAQVINTSQSVPGDLPFAEDSDVSWNGTKGLENFESNHSVNPCLSETPMGKECETDTLTQTRNLEIQPVSLTDATKVPSSDNLLLEDKTEPKGQTALVAVKEFPSTEKILVSKIDPEDIGTKAEEVEASFGGSQETVELETSEASLHAVDSIVADSNDDVSHAAKKTGVVDFVGHETELIQANDVAEENSPSKLSSESSGSVEHYVSPVSVVLEGDDANDQRQNSPETSKDSILHGAEACQSNDENCRESSNRGRPVEEITEKDIGQSGSTVAAHDDSAKSANQKLMESGRTEYNRVVGGLGVIQANEVDGNVKAQNFYAEVPVTIESNDHRDFGRLQNLSEAHIRSLVSSPLVTRNNTSNAFESNLGSVSEPNGEVNKPENASQPSSLTVALSKNQEITMEKTTSWSTEKEQHVPLKNLLSEARSPRLQAEAKKDHESNIPRVSSILDQETSPEDGRWPERREVSEEWNSPAKYPVDLKREEKKVKGKPFWVPFVCCSSVK